MKHPSLFLLLFVGAILAIQLASSVPNQQHQNNRLKSQKSEHQHHSKSEHHEAVQHQPRGKKLVKTPRQHHETVRAHGIKPRVHSGLAAHHQPSKIVHHSPSKAVHNAPTKHHAEGGGKRHLEIQKPPKPFLQPPLIPKHQRAVKHHGKQERNNKHR